MLLSSLLIVNGHTMLKIPVLVRSLQSSNVGPGQYLDGWPPGNTGCRWQIFYPQISIEVIIRSLWSQTVLQNETFLEYSKKRVVHWQFWNGTHFPNTYKYRSIDATFSNGICTIEPGSFETCVRRFVESSPAHILMQTATNPNGTGERGKHCHVKIGSSQSDCKGIWNFGRMYIARRRYQLHHRIKQSEFPPFVPHATNAIESSLSNWAS